MADKSELAKQATFLVSKVSKDVYGVDTMTGNLEAGRFKIGAGATEKKIGGRLSPGTKLGGMVPIISDNHLLLHDKSLYGDHGSRKWKEWYTKYAGMTKMGVIILAGTPENFSEWAKSKACREEVAEVPDGRLWAFVDGYVRRAPQRPPRFACPGVPRALCPSLRASPPAAAERLLSQRQAWACAQQLQLHQARAGLGRRV